MFGKFFCQVPGMGCRSHDERQWQTWREIARAGGRSLFMVSLFLQELGITLPIQSGILLVPMKQSGQVRLPRLFFCPADRYKQAGDVGLPAGLVPLLFEAEALARAVVLYLLLFIAGRCK